MNIDRKTNREKTIARKVTNRGRTDSAFEGDNHFRGLAVKTQQPKPKEVSSMFSYNDTNSLRLGIRLQQSVSSKYNYLNRHS